MNNETKRTTKKGIRDLTKTSSLAVAKISHNKTHSPLCKSRKKNTAFSLFNVPIWSLVLTAMSLYLPIVPKVPTPTANKNNIQKKHTHTQYKNKQAKL